MHKKGGCIFICYLSILVFIFSLLMPVEIKAHTYYVDQKQFSANDSNPGTLNLPWKTIQHAAKIMVAGDTVFISSGIYHEQVLTEQEGNAVQGHIVFSALPGEKPVIDGSNVTTGGTGFIIGHSYIKLIGLEIQNWSDTGIWLDGAGFVKITDCKVHDVVFGIGAGNGTHDFVLNRVEIYNFDLYGFDASPSGGADCYNGTFNDCAAHSGRDPEQNVDGFALGHGTQHNFEFNRCQVYEVYDGFDISSRNTRLNSCLAHDCWNGDYKLWQDKITLVNCIGYDSPGSIVELDWDEQPGAVSLMNCTFFNAQTYTIWIENPADTLNMSNCILAGGDNIALAFEQMGVANYVGDYNIFQNDNPNRIIVVGYTDEFTLNQVKSGDWTTYSGQDAHSITVDNATKLFVDPGNLDLHLKPNSPAIDTGTNTNTTAADFDGNLRPWGAGIDIGAYEYSGATGIYNKTSLKKSPPSFALHQNFPNPFNPETRIWFEITNNSKALTNVSLKIYNLQGQLVRSLLDEKKSPGVYTVQWNGLDDSGEKVATGVYLYSITAGDFKATKKMAILK